MQEEVTQKTIALYVKVGKGAARLTEQALQKAIQKFLEQKSKPAHGKQTMRQLMKQNAGVSNIEITDSNIKAFVPQCRISAKACYSMSGRMRHQPEATLRKVPSSRRCSLMAR